MKSPSSHGANSPFALQVSTPSEREILLSRTFRAPQKLVFEALSRPEHLRRWYGFRTDEMICCELDFRVGGAWRFELRSPDGFTCAFRGEFREIVPTSKIVQTSEYEGAPGQISLETLELHEENGLTTLTVLCQFEALEARDGMLHSGMEVGAGESYIRLQELLDTLAPSENDLLIERTFSAPRDLVWNAWTQNEHLARWCGPHGFEVTHCTGDLREGGAWRTEMQAPDGTLCCAKGVYLEIAPPSRLVFTHGWDGEDDSPRVETLVTVTLNEKGDQTEMIFRQRGFATLPSRDGHESGWTQAFERLHDALLDALIFQN